MKLLVELGIRPLCLTSWDTSGMAVCYLKTLAGRPTQPCSLCSFFVVPPNSSLDPQPFAVACQVAIHGAGQGKAKDL